MSIKKDGRRSARRCVPANPIAQCLPGANGTPRRSHVAYASRAIIRSSSRSSFSPSSGFMRHQLIMSRSAMTRPSCCWNLG